MKDFLGVFLMLLLVISGIVIFIFFSNLLGYWGLAILEILIVTAIILLFIRNMRSRRP